MTGDVSGNIQNITWTVYGKIATITKTDGTTVAYSYDAAGNRISKTVTQGGGQPTTTWYVRDASGNTMAVYTTTGSGTLTESEQDLYGGSRLGIFNRDIDADASLPAGTSANLIGNYFTSFFMRDGKAYELSNHLGNVLATISDKKAGVDNNSDGAVDYYAADIISANDYYPFGMGMPGRKYSVVNTNYRYGFNGKEYDNDIEFGMQNYGKRIYDPRLGKFLSVDPLTKKYPWFTPYLFSSNMPIVASDIDGLESIIRAELKTVTIPSLSNSDIFNVEEGGRLQNLSAMTDQIFASLDLPSKFKGDYGYLIKATIKDVISLNYVEGHPVKHDGTQNSTTITPVADLNYDLLFGNKKDEAVDRIGKAFDFAETATGTIESPDQDKLISPKISYGLKTINYGLKLLNGKYGEAGLDATKEIAGGMIGYGAQQSAISFGVAQSIAKVVGAYSTSVVNLLLTPLDANAPVGLATRKLNNEIKEVKTQTISALLFYFMKNNKQSMVPSASSLQQPISDHTEDHIKVMSNQNRPK
jgi:RHS repeat-associated protein